MNKRQRETEKASAAMVARERSAVLKLLQELGYGVRAKNLTAPVLKAFAERNLKTLYPNSHTLAHKTSDDIYSTLKGLYRQSNLLAWNIATNRVNSKVPLTKTVGSYSRYLTEEDTQNDEMDDVFDAPSPQNNTKSTSTTSRWGPQHFISRPPLTDDEDEMEDTDEDEE
jgi:hypothetical protein